MSNWLGLLFSYLFVFFIIGISTLGMKKGLFKEEGSRKFIHIGVANWWLIAMYFFKDQSAIWFAIVPPISFIILNYYSYKTSLIASMERENNKDLGTVYFPISLLILVILTFGVTYHPEIGLAGILTLGYGDGFAAVIGKKYGKHRLIHGKSIEGSIAMFVFTFFVLISIILYYNIVGVLGVVVLLSLAATVIELWTPKGLDNLSIPLIISLLFYLFIL